jgi:RNA polymerase sigma factor for flagellar operon FliA
MSRTSTIEDQKYWDQWIESKDSDSGDYLIKKYMPLVSYHSQRISVGLPKNVSRDDIKSLGMMGLLDALHKFDTTRDLKFDTYASFRIRGAILDGLRKEDWLPRSTREKAKKIEAVIEELEQKELRHIKADEIAKELNMTTDDIYQTMNEHFFANVLSTDDHLRESEDSEGPAMTIKDNNVLSPDDELMKQEMLKELTSLIQTLSEKEQTVLSLFYHEELTLTEIGEILNLSTSRISQIHSKALFRLRKVFAQMNVM